MSLSSSQPPNMDDLPIGRYGTIHYMSNNGSEIPLASYPVDEEVINIGCSDHNTCHIRLFDRWVSDIHCKLKFEEGKAFLVVLGQNGVVIDGANQLPSLDENQPATVPLTNGSEWLIYKRRFIWSYPPKKERASLLATPRTKSRKSLRMSMIKFAHLWTPSAPSTDAIENLDYLMSPMKPYKGEQTQVTLVEGKPLQVSHSQDEIVVMENVVISQPDMEPPVPSSPSIRNSQTPSRKGQSNLHKQVLLMNSHRKHIQDVDEEEEEQEVEATILMADESDEEISDDPGSNPFLSKSSGGDRSLTEEAEEEANGSYLSAKSFRASLGAIGSILPFGRPSGVVHSPGPQQDAPQPTLTEQAMEPEEIRVDPVTPPPQRSLGSFYTPQAQRDSRFSARKSVGGGSAKYVDLDNDIEQARRRLANLGTASRPQVVYLDDQPEEPSHPQHPPQARSVKKPRVSLADIPELSSPLLDAKGRYSIAPMAAISEPAEREDEDMEDDTTDTAARLQKLTRTVENEARRESIREARRSSVIPFEFYASTNRTSPKRESEPLETLVERLSPSPKRAQSRPLATPSKTADKFDFAGSSSPIKMLALDDEVDTSAKESDPAPPKTKQAASKKTQVIGKRRLKATEEQMQIDEPVLISDDPQMMEVDERPVKKARTTRGAATSEPSAAPKARRTKKTAAAAVPIQEEGAEDEDSGTRAEVEEPVAKSSRSRQKADGPSTQAEPPKRGGRRKATAVPDHVEDPSESSASGMEPPAPAPRGKGRKAKAAPAPKVESESIGDREDDDDDELDAFAAPKPAPAKRATRGKAAVKVEEDSEHGSEEVVQAKKSGSKVSRGKTTAAAIKDTVDGETESSNAPSKSRTTRKAVKEAEDVEPVVEAKPKRTTRSKR